MHTQNDKARLTTVKPIYRDKRTTKLTQRQQVGMAPGLHYSTVLKKRNEKHAE